MDAGDGAMISMDIYIRTDIIQQRDGYGITMVLIVIIYVRTSSDKWAQGTVP